MFSNNYEKGHMMSHIDLAKWADIFVICPATANTINELSQGLASNAVGTLFLAYDLTKPILLAPATEPTDKQTSNCGAISWPA